MDHKPYTDKYFLRTNQILKAKGWDPWVRAQVFIRRGPGEVAGLAEAIDFIRYAGFTGRIFAIEDGETYCSAETLMLLEGRLQELVELETVYLGIISARTTVYNLNKRRALTQDLDSYSAGIIESAREIFDKLTSLCHRPVYYGGARHWHWSKDRKIAQAAFAGGANDCSTDIGGSTVNKEGIGTIPHVLETVTEWLYDKDRAVVEATKAFDEVIDLKVPRIALVDYANHELTDTLTVAKEIPSLSAVRVDTCGENVMQGGLSAFAGYYVNDTTHNSVLRLILDDTLINIPSEDLKYWFGNGVTVKGVWELNESLRKNGQERVKVILSSGFGSPKKMAAFIRAEDMLQTKLFDSVLVGDVFGEDLDLRFATMDVVAVGRDSDGMRLISKTGRPYRPNIRLVEK